MRDTNKTSLKERDNNATMSRKAEIRRTIMRWWPRKHQKKSISSKLPNKKTTSKRLLRPAVVTIAMEPDKNVSYAVDIGRKSI